MKIEMGSHPPIRNRISWIKDKIFINLAEILAAKIIARSKSPWSFPLVDVRKKDGTQKCV